jgi:putative hydrolase of the HAD superfamily|tara:strand:+ start:31 stop:678 length:648 start_codon:yes stop_codon:yes gene_type:complete
MQSPFRALLFDFDGLIVDTEWPIYNAWRQTFHDHGHSLPLEIFTQCIGTDFDTWSPKTHLEELTGDHIDWHLLDNARQARIETELVGATAMEGIPKAVKAAKAAGLKVAVVSSSSHRWVDGWLKKIGLFEQFDTTVCRDDAERIKPAPDLYLVAARQLALEPATCLVIEDSVNGIKAAKSAGMPSVAIPNRVTAGCDFSLADRVLKSAAELLALI